MLATVVRDAVAEKLRGAFPANVSVIEHWLIGRNAEGTNGGKADERIRLIPLPSIGHPQADQDVRRILVEVPAQCPIRTDDLFWATSGLEFGEEGSLGRLTAVDDISFLRHFGAERGARRWQTLTPAALPESARRRRIEPKRRLAEAKNASERAAEQQHAGASVLTALGHAGVKAKVVSMVLQREPFQGRGARAEAFAPGTRFAKERLWHVEIEFAEPVAGPLLLGDGRFLGLGLLAPLSR